MVVAERDEVDAVTLESIAEAEKARFTGEELAKLRREIEELRNALRRYSHAQQQRALFEALASDLEKVRSQLEAADARLSRLQDAKAEITGEFDALRELREQAAVSSADLRARIDALKDEIGAIEQQIRGVSREIDESDAVDPRDLVPRGSGRVAVFAECEKSGVKLMPAGTFLPKEVRSQSRQTFLSQATATRYVVFLVRPQGFDSFEKYREVIEDYNETHTERIDFGYEPADADWKFVYPESRG